MTGSREAAVNLTAYPDIVREELEIRSIRRLTEDVVVIKGV